jgi:hypothetical protein
MKAAALLACALLLAPAASLAGGDQVYTDKTWAFGIAIPFGWSQLPPRDDEPDVRFVLKGPHGDQEFCNVTVGDVPGLATKTQGDLDALFRKGEFKTGFVDDTQNNHPDAKERRGETIALHGHLAQLTEMAVPEKAHGKPFTLVIENLLTLTPGRSYSANCSAEAGQFDRYRPEIERILKSVTPLAFKTP